MYLSGDSAITCKGVHKVLWSVKADIEDGYLLFITGDPVSLGCWEPDMAIHLSRCRGHANLWTSEIKVVLCAQCQDLHFTLLLFIFSTCSS